MKRNWPVPAVVLTLVLSLACQDACRAQAPQDTARFWQQQAVDYARIMSRVRWTPVADGMPNRRGSHFEKGKEYTGVPYSSVKTVGRCIGFDIYLKTFLAAVENPQSVLYTENLAGQVSNAATYYGKVCSTYTSYALQCAVPYRSSHHDTQFRTGVELVEPQSAQAAQIGDVIYTPPATVGGGSHVELVTGVQRDGDRVTAVRVEDSWPPTTRNLLRPAAEFDAHISARNRQLLRITDFAAWHEQNRADMFLFPNYAEDTVTPVINRVLLLDRGDWVPYFKDQPVKFNVMDRDNQGVQTLVIKRGEELVEEVPVLDTGVIQRQMTHCGNYTAHCVMRDGSLSQPCEFAVCELAFQLPAETLSRSKPWELSFAASNLRVIAVQLLCPKPPYRRNFVWLTDQDRRSGQVTVPVGQGPDAGRLQVQLISENKYGRLTRQQEVEVTD